jgi:hypothetical protein
LIVDYLRGNATASAIGLYVVCRYLSNAGGGQSGIELQRSLQVLRSSDPSQTETSAVLDASLTVGEALGVVTHDKASSTWAVDAKIGTSLRLDGDQWLWFRGELVHRMMDHALENVEGKVPDLILGLTWFLQISPLNPLQTAWGAGTESKIRKLGFEAVSRSEQWLSFQRWALSLGFARRSDQPNARVLIPDASTAIADQLIHLAVAGTAREWVATLRDRIPVFGAQVLVDHLPKGGDTWSELPPSLMMGLLKLEAAGVLLLEPSDDARDVIAVGLGTSVRQVGRISIRSSS